MYTSNYDIADLARDIAFEICLGGDRFTPEDAQQWLEGIPESDIDTLRHMIYIHSCDFSHPEAQSPRFVERMTDMWLDGIKTAESLGRTPGKSWFEGIDTSIAFYRYFVFDDGRIQRCNQATVRAAWGREAEKHIVGVMDESAVLKHYAEALLKDYGYNVDGIRKVELSSGVSLPEGRFVSLEKKGDEINVVLEPLDFVLHSRVSLQEAYRFYPKTMVDSITHELDERIMNDILQKQVNRDDLKELRRNANLLIDSAGMRVRADYLYDEVLLMSDDKEKFSLRRKVDDLSDKEALDLYVCRSTSLGSTMTLLSEKTEASVVSVLNRKVMDALSGLSAQDEVSVEDGTIRFKDGPFITVPEFGDEYPLTMKVNMLFYDAEGQPSVSGTVRRDGGEFQCEYPLVMLSDKALDKVKTASDRALLVLQSKEPFPEFKSKLSVEMKSNKKAVSRQI